MCDVSMKKDTKSGWGGGVAVEGREKRRVGHEIGIKTTKHLRRSYLESLLEKMSRTSSLYMRYMARRKGPMDRGRESGREGIMKGPHFYIESLLENSRTSHLMYDILREGKGRERRMEGRAYNKIIMIRALALP